jgi:hypothetical protein
MRISLSLVLPIVAILLGVLYTLDNAAPTFDTAVLSSIVSSIHRQHRSSPLSLNATLHQLQLQLHSAYPSHVHLDSPWLFNLAGGFKSGLLLYHASLTEYVAIWGSAVRTTGHSGRNWATFDDWLLTGHGTWWVEGSLNVTTHGAGEHLHTERWAGRIVELEGGTWMLEHCHGVIPALLPFGLGDGLLSSMDPLLVWKSLILYGRLTIHSLMQGKL